MEEKSISVVFCVVILAGLRVVLPAVDLLALLHTVTYNHHNYYPSLSGSFVGSA